jgi:hypothetical protein
VLRSPFTSSISDAEVSYVGLLRDVSVREGALHARPQLCVKTCVQFVHAVLHTLHI